MEKIGYPAFNALARRALTFGVPFGVGLALLAVGVLGGLFLSMAIGIKGFLWLLPVGGVYLGVRELCMGDDMAVDVLMIEMKWYLRGLLAGRAKTGGQLVIVPMAFGVFNE